jgi:predicted ATPase/DNA-binding winged helix-turn-helix (wHTH) protein
MLPQDRYAEFGAFRLFAPERRLVRAGKPVSLGSRALDILILLVEKAGSVVSKRELISYVWPDVIVEESCLRVQVANLRKVLGEGEGGVSYILNIAGRGYRFSGQVTYGAMACSRSLEQTQSPPCELPSQGGPIIGRDEDVRKISELLAAGRFVTVHGPGGIGKTKVALAVADGYRDRFEDGIRFLDLGTRKAHDPVADVLAATLGLAEVENDPTPRIVDYLRSRQMLLILDCCEHVVDAVAGIAGRIVENAPDVSLLVTSREPLRIAGEYLFALPPLESPPAGAPVAPDQLTDYSAARLFLEHAFAAGHRCELSEIDAEVVADICRKADGIALVLELAAARVGMHGLRETAALMDSGLCLLWQGRRTALPRHQTLAALLDWSYDLIGRREQAVLMRLSTFVTKFTLDEAKTVAADDGIGGAEVVEALERLVAKSFVVADTSGDTTRYRIWAAARAYAQARHTEREQPNTVIQPHVLQIPQQLTCRRIEPLGQVHGEDDANGTACAESESGAGAELGPGPMSPATEHPVSSSVVGVEAIPKGFTTFHRT